MAVWHDMYIKRAKKEAHLDCKHKFNCGFYVAWRRKIPIKLWWKMYNKGYKPRLWTQHSVHRCFGITKLFVRPKIYKGQRETRKTRKLHHFQLSSTSLTEKRLMKNCSPWYLILDKMTSIVRDNSKQSLIQQLILLHDPTTFRDTITKDVAVISLF